MANANTSAGVTELVCGAARRVATPGTEVTGATARFGAAVIGSRVEQALAEHACVDLLAREAAGFDGVVVATSLDSGVRAGRQMLGVPVVGMTEAALHAACLVGGRFGVVCVSAASGAMTREMVEEYGLISRMAGMGWVEGSAEAVLADPAAAAGAIGGVAARLVREGADSVVVVGAVMAGVAGALRVGVPVLEGVACATVLVEAMVRLGLGRATAGSFAAVGERRLGGVDPAIGDWLRR